MKVFLSSACAIALSLGAARADDLTIGNCLDIAAGLNALDHFDDAATGKPKQYRLGATRIAIGLNMAALRHVTEAVDKAKVDLISEAGNGKPVNAFSATETAHLNEEYLKLLNRVCEVKPGRIKASDLHLGDGPEENAIPPSVIAALAPILDQ